MSETANQDLFEIFRRIPLLKKYRPEDFKIESLPGYTNHNFRITNDQHDWILRIPKPETNRYINRLAETNNASIAHSLGLAAECLWRDRSGLSLSVTLRNTRELTVKELQQNAMLGRVVELLARLHRSARLFQGEVDLDALLTRYFHLIPEPRQRKLSGDYENAKQMVKSLAPHDDALVPSHNDLVLQNLLVDGSGRIWIIDWEYASMASPYWDLATLCNVGEFDEEQSLELLRMYWGDRVEKQMDLLQIYRIVLKTLSDCWMAALA